MRSRQQPTPVDTADSAPELGSSDTSGTHAIASHIPELQRALRERDTLRAERDELARRLKAAVDELALLKASLSAAAPPSELLPLPHETSDRRALLPDNAPTLPPPLPVSVPPAPSISPASDSGRWPMGEPSLSRIIVSTRPPADALRNSDTELFDRPSSDDRPSSADRPSHADRPSNAERRRRGRRGGEFEVEFLDDTHLIAGLTQDISEGGVFVATYQTLALGTKVTLGLELPVGRVQVRGEVRWARPEIEGSDQRPGFGVAFTELTAEALAALRQFCLSHPAHYYEM
jgi:uncharacterized protein (TIGR02266 family)